MGEIGWANVDVPDLIDRLKRYGHARNRDVDREQRLITITDDEALMILDMFVDALRNAPTIESESN